VTAREPKILKKQTLRNNEYYSFQEVQDELYARSEKGKIFKNLLPLILDRKNILLAYRNLKTNKGRYTAGTDGKAIADIEGITTDNLVRLVTKKLENFRPQSVRRIIIPKPNGKTRPLGIPTIEDKIVQQCIKQVLEPILEAKFYKHSYGFRPNRSTEHAIARLFHLSTLGKLHYAVDVDIKAFFDEVNHAKLLKQLWTLGIQDKNLLSILSKMLKAEVEGEGVQTKGLPQGGVLSTVLANVVLNELDWWIHSQWEGMKTDYQYKHQGTKIHSLKKSNLKEMYIIRYCDDFKILCRTAKDAQKTFVAVRQWLKERLGLEINTDKSKVVNMRKNHSEFLGLKIKIKPKKKGRVMKSHISDKSKKRIKKELKERIKEIKKNPTPGNCNRFNSTILGMQNYYNIASNCNLDFSEINYSVKKNLFNQTKNIRQKNGVITKSYQKLYGHYNYKVVTIANITLFPIAGVKLRVSKIFNPDICLYTEEGRKVIHNKLHMYLNKGIEYLLENPDKKENVAVNDMRLSIFSGQQGKCYITGIPLKLKEIKIHRKSPDKGDKYNNLVLVNWNESYLIYEKDMNLVTRIIGEMNLSIKGYNKLMNLRKLVGNYVI
jgi:group II intron reverse transcriptase/maturase